MDIYGVSPRRKDKPQGQEGIYQYSLLFQKRNKKITYDKRAYILFLTLGVYLKL